MVLVAFRHGLRVSNWWIFGGEQVDLEHALLHVRRVKERQPCHAPIDQQGITRREANTARAGGQITFRLHQRAWSAILKAGLSGDGQRAGKAAGFDVKIHPHMLRHACGFKLANDCVDTRTIQAYLGHKSIQHTVRYTELAPTRFKSLFRD
jgi:site-specific recombinase XerD